MDSNLKEGIKGRLEKIVGPGDTAAALGNGEVEVFSTPMMIGLMEMASSTIVDKFLPEGYTTVGTHLEVKHLSATPINMKVWAEAELIKIEGKALSFKIEAFDEVEKIGEGLHKRFVIPLDKFMKRTNEKAAKIK